MLKGTMPLCVPSTTISRLSTLLYPAEVSPQVVNHSFSEHLASLTALTQASGKLGFPLLILQEQITLTDQCFGTLKILTNSACDRHTSRIPFTQYNTVNTCEVFTELLYVDERPLKMSLPFGHTAISIPCNIRKLGRQNTTKKVPRINKKHLNKVIT